MKKDYPQIPDLGTPVDKKSKIRDQLRCLKHMSLDDLEMLHNDKAFEILGVDLSKYTTAKNNDINFQRNVPDEGIKIQDEESKHYFKIASAKDYYNINQSNIMMKVKMDHSEIISHDQKQRVYITLDGDTPGGDVLNIAKLYAQFISNKTKQDVGFSINGNFKDNEYDIVLDGCFAEDDNERRQMGREFIEKYEKYSKYLCERLSRHRKFVKKPTILSQYHTSDKKNQLDKKLDESLDHRQFIKIIQESLYTACDIPKNSGIIVNGDINIKINNIGTQNVNMEHDEYKNKINDFVEHIKNDKPNWYVSGKFIPKILLTEKFNEMFNVEFSTRKLISNLKKYGRKDEIIGKEIYGSYNDENFTDDRKRYRGFIAI